MARLVRTARYVHRVDALDGATAATVRRIERRLRGLVHPERVTPVLVRQVGGLELHVAVGEGPVLLLFAVQNGALPVTVTLWDVRCRSVDLA